LFVIIFELNFEELRLDYTCLDFYCSLQKYLASVLLIEIIFIQKNLLMTLLSLKLKTY